MTITYTCKERSLRTHTVRNAVNTALLILRERYNLHKVCTNALHRGRYRREDNEPITIVELNDLVQAMIDDTTYHEGLWTTRR